MTAVTIIEARNKIRNIDYFCEISCKVCTPYCPYCYTECITLQRARKMDFDSIVNSYAQNNGDLQKVYDYINRQAKIGKRTVT